MQNTELEKPLKDGKKISLLNVFANQLNVTTEELVQVAASFKQCMLSKLHYSRRPEDAELIEDTLKRVGNIESPDRETNFDDDFDFVDDIVRSYFAQELVRLKYPLEYQIETLQTYGQLDPAEYEKSLQAQMNLLRSREHFFSSDIYKEAQSKAKAQSEADKNKDLASGDIGNKSPEDKDGLQKNQIWPERQTWVERVTAGKDVGGMVLRLGPSREGLQEKEVNKNNHKPRHE